MVGILYQRQLQIGAGGMVHQAQGHARGHIAIRRTVQQPHRAIERDLAVQDVPLLAFLDQLADAGPAGFAVPAVPPSGLKRSDISGYYGPPSVGSRPRTHRSTPPPYM